MTRLRRILATLADWLQPRCECMHPRCRLPVVGRGGGDVSADKVVAVRMAPACGCMTTGKIVRGMCVKHYDRWVQATPKEDRPVAPRFARSFWDFVDKSGDCWLWTGPVNAKGYGWWSNGDERGLSHRISLARETPPPAPELMACHNCDTPACIRPSHLYWGTAADNSRDMVERGGVHNKGQFATECKRGHAMVGENIRVVGRDGKRQCRECDNMRSRERQRRYREARRAVAQ